MPNTPKWARDADKVVSGVSKGLLIMQVIAILGLFFIIVLATC